ncbi:MliC family protein [Brevundimonas sp.]|uniref:MliC family protein n=1 Tax=Brevundimonas sp. TaxID=1871086 RepID=UPI003B006490
MQYADSDSAQLTYQNQTYALRSVQSASGARYVGAGMEWWTATRDGQESGTLSRLGPDGTTGVAVLERCSRPIPGADLTPGPLPTPAQTPHAGPRRRPAGRDALQGAAAEAGGRRWRCGRGQPVCATSAFRTSAPRPAA